MKLHKLLLKVLQNEPLNFEQLVALLPRKFRWDAIFKADMVSAKKYRVQVLDQEAFIDLLNISLPADSRSQAARSSLSHSHVTKCDSVYKLVFPSIKIDHQVDFQSSTNTVVNNNSNTELETLLLHNESLIQQRYTQANYAVLIENQDCFFNYAKFLTLFKDTLPKEAFDVYFSAGSQILDTRLSHFLNKYEKIFCLFDYDLAGLEIYSRLNKTLTTNLTFAVPDSHHNIQPLFTFKAKSTDYWLTAIATAKSLELPKLVDHIQSTQHFMEQEALLTLLE